MTVFISAVHKVVDELALKPNCKYYSERYLLILEANRFAISEGSLIQSTTEAHYFVWCLSLLTADQKPVFLLSENDLEGFSRTRWFFRRFMRRTDDLYFFLAFYEGHLMKGAQPPPKPFTRNQLRFYSLGSHSNLAKFGRKTVG